MKRLLPIILTALLLAGCSAGNHGETAAPAAETAEPTVPLVSLYDPESEVEAQTGGAVKAYPLGDGSYTGLYTMAGKLLVVSADGTLTLLQGEKGEVAATAMMPANSSLTVGRSGACYYVPDTREVVVLDDSLQEQQRISLPAESTGTPVLQPGGQIFYCVGSDIRAFDIATGVSRLVRQHSCSAQELTGSYFDDTVIGCRIEDEDGSVQRIYISADTGERFAAYALEHTLMTGGSWYFGICPEDAEHPYVYGSWEGETMCLYPEETTLLPALERGGVVGCTEEGVLTFYDFQSGKQTARVELPGQPNAIAADGSYVYLVIGGVLYRWDVAASPLQNETVYTDARYTADSPDAAGIADCKLRAQSLRDNYGLDIYLWDEAERLAGTYCQTPEHRVSTISDCLDQLEAVVKTFPDGFLSKANVKFYLVEALPEGRSVAQYWDASGCHVVLNSTDTVKSFLWGLGFAIDTYVLNHCRAFDNWDDLNPRDFAYTYDYEENLLREDWEDDLDFFIDLESMSFPTEDRSRIFMYALLPEGEAYFQERDIQDKLEQVCEAIREAYEWEKTTEVYPWEQYLA